MPDSVAEAVLDEEYSDPGATNIQYSEGKRLLLIRALSMADIRAFAEGAEFTTQDFVAMLVESGEFETLEVSQLDETQPLLYAAGSTIGDDKMVYSAIWTVPNGDWVVLAAADTPEARTELVHAFIEACQSVG